MAVSNWARSTSAAAPGNGIRSFRGSACRLGAVLSHTPNIDITAWSLQQDQALANPVNQQGQLAPDEAPSQLQQPPIEHPLRLEQAHIGPLSQPQQQQQQI